MIKSTIIDTKPSFTPVTIQITCSTPNDLKALAIKMNLSNKAMLTISKSNATEYQRIGLPDSTYNLIGYDGYTFDDTIGLLIDEVSKL